MITYHICKSYITNLKTMKLMEIFLGAMGETYIASMMIPIACVYIILINNSIASPAMILYPYSCIYVIYNTSSIGETWNYSQILQTYKNK